MVQIWEVYEYIPIIFNVAACSKHAAETPACMGVIDA